eukprot:CAMPEP_0206400072 /NCGR_PEP_ID=MMETSP0294-20121207/25276_1 /ASSEMBLY_ACC=CAM_ASM_000327 /TAXON_ID=39354 /ORGANISM="Heterosigma akashiwo, Strain CCMP2393" /LENGTH=30 /DNA_ID= /DNA_START= /DNA_END= /DNA_ORIENTATION=
MKYDLRRIKVHHDDDELALRVVLKKNGDQF